MGFFLAYFIKNKDPYNETPPKLFWQVADGSAKLSRGGRVNVTLSREVGGTEDPKHPAGAE